MKISNDTKWSTADLRAMARAIKREMTDLVNNPATLVFSQGKTLYPRWRRWGDGDRTSMIAVSLPSAKLCRPSVVEQIGAVEDGITIPQVVILRWIEQFVAACGGSRALDAIEEFTVRLAPEKSKLAGAMLQRKKLEGLQAKLAVWTPKLKRAQTKVKKITQEIKRRERLLAQLEAS